MASNIVELFGYAPGDSSSAASLRRDKLECPFLEHTCVKKLGGSVVSGVCTLKPKKDGPVICCPVRLYADDYKILKEIAAQAFGPDLDLVSGAESGAYRAGSPGKAVVAVFGKGWGKELRLPNRSKAGIRGAGAYFVDWVLAHVDATGRLLDFVAVEVQSIDTTGNYQAERAAYMNGEAYAGSSSAGFNWENVNKRILPQIIYKGHVLRQEPLCSKGLFFVCPTPVYTRVIERLGGQLRQIHQQAGALTIMHYDLGEARGDGSIRDLVLRGQLTTTVDQVALAFTAPQGLPPPRVYEQAIKAEL
jgi:hypothetical protein